MPSTSCDRWERGPPASIDPFDLRNDSVDCWGAALKDCESCLDFIGATSACSIKPPLYEEVPLVLRILTRLQ